MAQLKIFCNDSLHLLEEDYNEFESKHKVVGSNPPFMDGEKCVLFVYYEVKNKEDAITDSSEEDHETETNHQEKPKNNRWGYAYFKEDGTFEIIQIVENQPIKLKVHPHVDELKKSKDNYIWEDKGVILLKNGFKKKKTDPDYNIFILKKTS